MHQPDLQVTGLSHSLSNTHLDVIVSGSIGATEAVKFIRSLRRLGAKVTPWLTEGGAQFVTPMALEWAAGREAITHFSGTANHVAEHDGCVIAPASANIIENIVRGVTSTPATALLQSYLGQKLPVMLVPNMHRSMFDSPIVQRNVKEIREYITFMEPRGDEGKLKFPDPTILADEVSHRMNHARSSSHVMVTLGSTKGYIDDVRYVSNYSSGRLGSLIAEEFYRHGFSTHIVAGSCPHKPQVYTEMTVAEENAPMMDAVGALRDRVDVAVMAASVLDFVPGKKLEGKTRSSKGPMHLELVNTPKIIEIIDGNKIFKIGFKLEMELDDSAVKTIAGEYFNRYNLSLFILNELKAVSADLHRAYAVTKQLDGGYDVNVIDSKQEISRYIVEQVIRKTGTR